MPKKPAAKSSPAKKTKTKNPWSDSDEETTQASKKVISRIKMLLILEVK